MYVLITCTCVSETFLQIVYVSLESFPPSFDSKCRNPLKLIKTSVILNIKDTDPETLNPHFSYVSLGSITIYSELIYFI